MPDSKTLQDSAPSINIDIPITSYDGPSIVFWTLHKAGSRYLLGVLRKLGQSVGAPNVNFAGANFQAQTGDELSAESAALCKPTGYIYGPFRRPQLCAPIPGYDLMKRFLVVRDPRDILVSHYFSARYSHRKPGAGPNDVREENTDLLPLDEHVIMTGRKFLPRWQTYVDMLNKDSALKLYKYEYFIDHFDDFLADLVQHLDLPVPEKRLSKITDNHEAEVEEENVHVHKRQVRPGDHVRKLAPETIDELNTLFADVLERFDYPLRAEG